jgi:hypothetical protein
VPPDPYAPPQATLEVEVSPPAPARGFRSTAPPARAIAQVMGINVVVNVLTIANCAHAISILRRAVAGCDDTSALMASHMPHRVLETMTLMLYLAAIVLFCWFMPRANRNARAFGALALRYSPGLSAAAFFVPLVNLFAPYFVLKEIWQASDPNPIIPAAAVRLPLFARIWWPLFLLDNFVGLFSVFSLRHVRTAAALISRMEFDVAGALTSIAAALAVIPTVRALARRQDERQRAIMSAGA